MQSTLKMAVIGLVAVLSLGLAGCQEETNRNEAKKEQESNLERARSAVPTPQMDHFIVRKAVAEYMKRQDVPQKTFYVYVMADNGQQLGYYVAQTKPISACNLMTPPDQLHVYGGSGKVAGTVAAPNLDGVYSAPACGDSHFFFDAETDALIEINGLKFFTADQPLSIDSDPIKVHTTSE